MLISLNLGQGVIRNMKSTNVMNELRHEIHSPLAALRNALYLISMRCDDFQILEYVKLAEVEAKEIAAALRRAPEASGAKAA